MAYHIPLAIKETLESIVRQRYVLPFIASPAGGNGAVVSTREAVWP